MRPSTPSWRIAPLRFLRGNDIDIDPRKQWADLKRIPKELQVERGKVLCQYGDGGWGERVEAQLLAGAIDDDLVDALVGLVRTWRPHPRPTWVTAVPSLRRPRAGRVARARVSPRSSACATSRRSCRFVRSPPQSEMSNTSQQAANVAGAFALSDPIPDGPVLLVDDLIASRWTVATIGAVLRESGSGPVFPIALARGAA